jgi:hypothetical protein
VQHRPIAANGDDQIRTGGKLRFGEVQRLWRQLRRVCVDAHLPPAQTQVFSEYLQRLGDTFVQMTAN